jgi:hypothetical protein
VRRRIAAVALFAAVVAGEPRAVAASGGWTCVATLGDRAFGVAALSAPMGLSLDHRGRLFIADSGNDRIVVLDSSGAYESEFGRFGSEPGQFLTPTDVAAREGFFYYVADSENERVQKFDRFRAFLGV